MATRPTGLWAGLLALTMLTPAVTLTAGAPAPPAPRLWVDPTQPITRVEPDRESPALTAPSNPGLTARFAPNVLIAPGTSPAGYLALSLFGTSPIGGVGDDTLTTFTVPDFWFGGELYNRFTIASNGYIVLGGGSGPDNSISNQDFPNPARPNNVLAPFWTDLNPAGAGALRIDVLTDGDDSWIVIDWAGVREFSSGAKTHSFEIWIGTNSDAHPEEDVTFVYGANTGNGDGGFTTVGAENWKGSKGQVSYYNGTGTLPSNGTELRVTTDLSSQAFLPLVQR